MKYTYRLLAVKTGILLTRLYWHIALLVECMHLYTCKVLYSVCYSHMDMGALSPTPGTRANICENSSQKVVGYIYFTHYFYKFEVFNTTLPECLIYFTHYFYQSFKHLQLLNKLNHKLLF